MKIKRFFMVVVIKINVTPKQKNVNEVFIQKDEITSDKKGASS